jgi:hypothetical protein
MNGGLPAGPRPRPRPSWTERQQQRNRQRLWRLLDHSPGLRLLVAVLAACLLLGGVNRWENCRKDGFRQGCLLRDTGGVVNVGNVEALSIVSAAFLYLVEGGRRRRRDNMEALEVILNCQQAGARLSLARCEALEQLSARGLWLDGLDLSGAHLEELQAPHARWRQVNLQGACLRRACLHDADLQGSDLSGADLSGADLRHADLRRVGLEGANLRGADLRGAALEGARLTDACLEETSLAPQRSDLRM